MKATRVKPMQMLWMAIVFYTIAVMMIFTFFILHMRDIARLQAIEQSVHTRLEKRQATIQSETDIERLRQTALDLSQLTEQFWQARLSDQDSILEIFLCLLGVFAATLTLLGATAHAFLQAQRRAGPNDAANAASPRH